MINKLFFTWILLPSALLAVHPIIPGFERVHGTGNEPIEGGRLLIGELSCTACHKATKETSAQLTKRQAPILTDVAYRVKKAYLKAFLANPQQVKPGTLMPKMFKDGDTESVDAVVAYLESLKTGNAPKTDVHGNAKKRGEQMFKDLGCVACHSNRSGNGNKLKEDGGYELPSVPLGNLSAKYLPDGLAAFLEDPLKVRPSGRMPSFRLDQKDAGSLAAFLTGETPKNAASPTGTPPSEAGNQVAFRYVKTEGKMPKDFNKKKIVQQGTLGGVMLKKQWSGNNFAVEFTSFFYAEHDGKYEFGVKSDDGSFVFVNDKEVVANGGIHPATKEKRGSANLKKGFHALRVTYNEAGGQQALELFVRGPKLPKQYLPARLLSLDKKTPPPLKKEVVDAFTEPDQALIAKGAALYRSMGCASCHNATENGKTVQSELKAKPLAQLSTTANGCQAGSGPGPHFTLNDAQTTALAAALKDLKTPSKPTPESRIRQTMTAMNCYACHERDGIGGPGQKRAPFFGSNEDDMGPEGSLPPGLTGVGAKLKPDTLKDILTIERLGKNQSFPRHYVKVRMPYFGKKNLDHLLADLPAADGFKADEPVTDRPDLAAGRQLVGAKGMACVTCHQYAGNKALGIQGPELTDMPRRLTKSWFKRWLLAPQSIRETTRMPSFWPAGKSVNPHVLGGDTDKQIDAIWAYLGGPKGGRPPEGINAKNYIPVEPTERPTLYRNFYGKAPSRGIGVAYPERVNLLFDANYMRLVQVWRGEFINAGIHWIARGQGAANPTGTEVVDLFHADPFAFIGKDEPWPNRVEFKGDLPGRKSNSRFKGYTLDNAGRPSFTYTHKDVTIRETYVPVKIGDRVVLQRTLSITGKKPLDGLYFFGARGKSITKTANGAYRVNDDLSLSFNLTDWQEPEIRPNQDGFDMVIPIKPGLTNATLTETINW